MIARFLPSVLRDGRRCSVPAWLKVKAADVARVQAGGQADEVGGGLHRVAVDGGDHLTGLHARPWRRGGRASPARPARRDAGS